VKAMCRVMTDSILSHTEDRPEISIPSVGFARRDISLLMVSSSQF
jgi:hypothetical protein